MATGLLLARSITTKSRVSLSPPPGLECRQRDLGRQSSRKRKPLYRPRIRRSRPCPVALCPAISESIASASAGFPTQVDIQTSLDLLASTDCAVS